MLAEFGVSSTAGGLNVLFCVCGLFLQYLTAAFVFIVWGRHVRACVGAYKTGTPFLYVFVDF